MTDDPQLATLVALADRATADLDGADDVALARRAAALGRRRLRTRTALRTAGALAAASALAVAGVQLFPAQLSRVPFARDLVPSPAASPAPAAADHDPYAHFLGEPARGPLAGDEAFARKAFAAWATARDVSANRDRGVFDDLRGEPHLVWAGQTQTGPAAVVVQRAYLHPHEGLPEAFAGPQTLIGYLVTGPDGALRLAADDYGPDEGESFSGAVSGLVGLWLDEDHRVLWLVDPGYPLAYSTDWVYQQDGSVTRIWWPVRFEDGAVSIDLPADVDPGLVRVARPPVADQWDVQKIGPDPGAPDAAVPVVAEAGRLPWASGARACVPLPGAESDVARCEEWRDALHEARQARTAHGAQTTSTLGGTILGRTPDGRVLLAGPMMVDHDPARVVAGVLTGTDPAHVTACVLVDAGPVDPGAPLPVAVRLPEAQGWVVAHVGATLRYRTGPGAAWQDAGRDAALLPDADSLQVEVTPAGQAPTVVTLGG